MIKLVSNNIYQNRSENRFGYSTLPKNNPYFILSTPINKDTVTFSSNNPQNTSSNILTKKIISFLGNKKDAAILETKIRQHFDTKEGNNIEDIIPLVRDWLKLKLSHKRFQHSIGSELTARKISHILDIEEKTPALAALLHDNAKELSKSNLNKIIKFFPSKFMEKNDSNGHALAGALIAENNLGIKNKETLEAIKYHNINRANRSNIEMIVHIADRIEPGLRSKSSNKKILKLLKENYDLKYVSKKV